MRVRADVDIARKAGLELDRAHVVEEGEGAHHPPAVKGQDPPHLEAAEILAALVDDEVDQWRLQRSSRAEIGARGGGRLVEIARLAKLFFHTSSVS